ncbi:MAG: hypothetical protein ACPG4T_11275 [Nannocystaceae bacterium]
MLTSSRINPSRPSRLVTQRLLMGTLGLLLGGSVACYTGGDREKQAPKGYAGGLCLAGGICEDPEATCDAKGNYCYNPLDPCDGFFCNSNGTCTPVGAKPSCVCDPGFSNVNYSLYCE